MLDRDLRSLTFFPSTLPRFPFPLSLYSTPPRPRSTNRSLHASSFRSSAILFRSNNRCNGFFFYYYYYYYYYCYYYSLGQWAVAALERGQSKARLQIKCIFPHTPPNHREILIVHGAQTRYDIVHAIQIDFLI